MGRYLQEYPQHNTDRKPEVDGTAWAFASAKLAAMPSACVGDLEAAAYSYLLASVQQQGASDLFTAEALRLKADKLAGFWNAKHRASRQTRPHTRYSAEQAKRGRVVSQYRRGRASDVLALRAQLARDRGAEVGTIAAALGLTPQHSRRLLRRRFSRVLVLALLRTFGKNSVCSPSQTSVDTETKPLPNVRLEVGRAEIRPERDRVDEDGNELATIRAVIEATKAHLRGDVAGLLPTSGD